MFWSRWSTNPVCFEGFEAARRGLGASGVDTGRWRRLSHLSGYPSEKKNGLYSSVFFGISAAQMLIFSAIRGFISELF